MTKTAVIEEYGDFQTPPQLAARACKLLAGRGTKPASILEPTCGIGNFLLAAVDQFPKVTAGLSFDINDAYVGTAKDKLLKRACAGNVKVIQESFFDVDWPNVLLPVSFSPPSCFGTPNARSWARRRPQPSEIVESASAAMAR